MKTLKTLVLLFATALLSLSTLYAKVEYMKKEGKPCATCHNKDNKTLNEVGKCYEKTRKLADCKGQEAKPTK